MGSNRSRKQKRERFRYTDWVKHGIELYGEDKLAWRFICPNCALVLSFGAFMSVRDKLKGWTPYAECVGRYLPDQGCDWAAYGLFSGPIEVLEDDGKTHKAWSFRYAEDARPA